MRLHRRADGLDVANQHGHRSLHLDVAVHLRCRYRVGTSHNDRQHGECLASVVERQHSRLVIAARQALAELDDGHPSHLGQLLGVDPPRRVRFAIDF
jgi:hypothetical protein